MNTNKLALALAAALSVGSSFAVTLKTNNNVVCITGSTAFRSQAVSALEANYNGTNGWTLAAITGDSSHTGRLYAKTPSTNGNIITRNFIAVHWTGSEGGIQTIADASHKHDVGFLPLTANTNTYTTADMTFTNGAVIAFADVKQGVSRFLKTGARGLGDTTAYAALPNPAEVGVLSFVWAASPNWPGASFTGKVVRTGTNNVDTNTYTVTGNTTASDALTAAGNYVTNNLSGVVSSTNDVNTWTISAVSVAPATGANITKDIAVELFNNGSCPLSRFTGNTNDASKTVYLVGRNVDSGTRCAALLNSGLANTATIKQYEIASNNATPVLYHDETVNGLLCTNGMSGYSSGGTVSSTIAKLTTLTDTFAVGYVGKGDFSAGGNVALTYQGQTASTGNIASGNYPFWTVENIYQPKTISPKVCDPTLANSVYSTLVSTIQAYTTSQLGGNNVSLSDMTVKRSVDGGAISSK